METKNIMVIGVGFHARRIYVPSLMDFSDALPIRLVAGVDVFSEKNTIEEYLKIKGYTIEMLYVNPFDVDVGLSHRCIEALDSLEKKEYLRSSDINRSTKT